MSIELELIPGQPTVIPVEVANFIKGDKGEPGNPGVPPAEFAEMVEKLGTIEEGATANSQDATLLNRANHTGTQDISTVAGLQDELDGKATSVQGAKADSAVQPGALAAVATSGSYADLSNKPSIPSQPSDIGAATAAQGAKADTAVQPPLMLASWANAQNFQLVSAIRDANSAIVTASIVWPDGISGVFTTDVASTAFPGAIDAWHATYLGSPTRVIAQTAVTRDANGAVTAQPAITIS